jgi:N-acetylglutamate synthase-like GNAT family acetyltransferase
MALKQIDHGSSDYKMMISLRDELLRRPLGLAFNKEELEREKEDILIGSFEDDRILGCCLLTRIDSQTVRLRQMAVRHNLQRKGIGDSIIRFAETLARDNGYRKIVMNARATAIGFYERCGYNICSDEFLEVTIPHKRMEKWLM